MSENILQVQALYERHPYPHYPLWAKPLWADGYLGSSLFAGQLILGTAPDLKKPRNFLSIGSGEILPYILRQWEPPSTHLHCVDLSQRSLSRAKFRTAFLGRQVSYTRGDINHILRQALFGKMVVDQAEAYGVLHHIPSFKTTLELVRDRLSPSGILRIMVYNRHARDWIWDISRAFAQLGLHFNSDRDVVLARDLLKKLALVSPRLSLRLSQMGRLSLENNTRFADTFLHPWESRASINTWFATIKSAGLKPMALYDRYGELDDLPNPLWQCPTAEQLTARARDLRFENNLELWLMRDDYQADKMVNVRPTGLTGPRPVSNIPWRLRLARPPQKFNYFDETKKLSFAKKWILWQEFLRAIHLSAGPQVGHPPVPEAKILKVIEDMAPNTRSRLGRIGLILPSTARDVGLYREMLQPMVPLMSPPALPDPAGAQVTLEVTRLCAEIQTSPQKNAQATARFIRAM